MRLQVNNYSIFLSEDHLQHNVEKNLCKSLTIYLNLTKLKTWRYKHTLVITLSADRNFALLQLFRLGIN